MMVECISWEKHCYINQHPGIVKRHAIEYLLVFLDIFWHLQYQVQLAFPRDCKTVTAVPTLKTSKCIVGNICARKDLSFSITHKIVEKTQRMQWKHRCIFSVSTLTSWYRCVILKYKQPKQCTDSEPAERFQHVLSVDRHQIICS